MKMHKELFKNELEKADQLLSFEERISANHFFLGGLLSLLERSQDGKVSANEIISIYKNGIEFAITNSISGG